MAKHATIKLSEIRSIARLQPTRAEAASVLGISVTKFSRLLKEDKRVSKAWEEGFELGKVSLRRKQMRLAGSNAQMAIHLGKQYLNQSETSKLEVSGPGGKAVEFDVAKLSRDERKQLRNLLTQSGGNSPSTG